MEEINIRAKFETLKARSIHRSRRRNRIRTYKQQTKTIPIKTSRIRLPICVQIMAKLCLQS